jgi:hypothetical protein
MYDHNSKEEKRGDDDPANHDHYLPRRKTSHVNYRPKNEGFHIRKTRDGDRPVFTLL